MIRNSLQTSLSNYTFEPKLTQSRSAAQLRLQAYQHIPRGKQNININLTPDKSPNRLGSKQKPSMDHDSARKSSTMMIKSNSFQRGTSFSPFSKSREQHFSPQMSKFQESSLSSRNNFCLNHPQKKAKYTSQDEQEQPYYYCSKCAIRLVSQGFKVKQIQQQNQPNLNRTCITGNVQQQISRQKEINKLLEQIHTVKPKLHSNLTLLQRMRHDFNHHYKDIVKKQDVCFDSLIQQITKAKKQKREGLIALAQDGSKQLNKIQLKLSDTLQDIILIRDDLKTQLPLIKTKVSSTQYRKIMNSYKQKVSRSKICLKQSQQIDLRMAQSDRTLMRVLQDLQHHIKSTFKNRDKLSSVNFSFEEKRFKRKAVIQEQPQQQEEDEDMDYQQQQMQEGKLGEYDDDGYSPNFKQF